MRAFARLFFVLIAVNGLAYAQDKSSSTSFYTDRISDHGAVYLDKDSFNVKADGITDDGPALQQAINKVESQSKSGIVFIPEGVYCIKTTVNLWRGIRVIGYGKKRPLFLLTQNTDGFQTGNKKYMIRFCDRRTPEGSPLIDGTPGTLFSGLSNVDFRIEAGNPDAIAVRFHVAQHSFLEHIVFDIGSAMAAIDEMGSEIRDCHFYGGEWGIKTGLPSAGWQAMVMDCNFTRQRKQAIETKDAGLTVFRTSFSDLPLAINILQGNNEKLFIKDCRFRNISEAAINVGNYYDPKTQITFHNLQFDNVPVSINFLLLPGVITAVSRDSLKRKADGPVYTILSFSHGLHVEKNANSNDAIRRFATISYHGPIMKMDDIPVSDIPSFPDQKNWVNMKDLGAKGDGKSDDTKFFIRAVDTYRAIYIPSGNYLVSETIILKKETALIGLHPLTTKIFIKDSLSAFSSLINPKPIFITPAGGHTIINGISIDPGYNPGAIAIQWMAGENSYLNDVHIPSRRSSKKGEGQMYGVWVTNGGGGVFKSSWFPNELARNGFYVSDTHTIGVAYMLSAEHHKTVELQLENVSNWKFYALQTEEDLGSDQAFAVTMDSCSNIWFANLYCYRRASVAGPFVSAIKLKASENIAVSGMHNFSSGPFPYDNSVYIEESKTLIPQAEISEIRIR